MRLLVVEDNDELSEYLIEAFGRAGYRADVATTLGAARGALFSAIYDALILDLGLPDGNGLSLLSELGQNNRSLPVLILSARGSIADRVEGLRAGAQDFLVKPFATEELVARIEVLLRRKEQEQSLKLGNLEMIIDQHGRQVFIDGQPQPLSPRDIAILEVLLERPKRAVSKRMLAAHIGNPAEITPNAIEVYVHRVRKGLEDGGAKVSIETVKGVGYMINETR
jgi:DNA-binding response OmpR family regulator